MQASIPSFSDVTCSDANTPISTSTLTSERFKDLNLQEDQCQPLLEVFEEGKDDQEYNEECEHDSFPPISYPLSSIIRPRRGQQHNEQEKESSHDFQLKDENDVPVDDSALSFYIDEVDKQNDENNEHGDIPDLFREHNLEFTISGQDWTTYLYQLKKENSKKDSMNYDHNLDQNQRLRLTCFVELRKADEKHYKPFGTTDIIVGEKDPQFTHRFMLPTFSMEDSQHVARNMFLRIRARCGGIEFGQIYISIASLIRKLIITEPLTTAMSSPSNLNLNSSHNPLKLFKSFSFSSSSSSSGISNSNSLPNHRNPTTPVITLKAIRGYRTHVLKNNVSLPIINKQIEHIEKKEKEQTIQFKIGISNEVITSLIETTGSSNTPHGHIRLGLLTACEKGGEWAMTQHARTKPSSSINSKEPDTFFQHERDVAQLCIGRKLLFGDINYIYNKKRQVRLQAMHVMKEKIVVLGFCQFTLKNLSCKKWLQWHVRGGKSMSAIVAIRSFSLTPSVINVCLEIGANLEFTKGGPVGVGLSLDDVDLELQEQFDTFDDEDEFGLDLGNIEEQTKSYGSNLFITKNNRKLSRGSSVGVNRRGSSNSIWNKLTRLASGSKHEEDNKEAIGCSANTKEKEAAMIRREKWKKKVVPVYIVRFPGDENQSRNLSRTQEQQKELTHEGSTK